MDISHIHPSFRKSVRLGLRVHIYVSFAERGAGGESSLSDFSNSLDLHLQPIMQWTYRQHRPGRSMVTKVFGKDGIELSPVIDVRDRHIDFHDIVQVATCCLQYSPHIIKGLAALRIERTCDFFSGERIDGYLTCDINKVARNHARTIVAHRLRGIRDVDELHEAKLKPGRFQLLYRTTKTCQVFISGFIPFDDRIVKIVLIIRNSS